MIIKEPYRPFFMEKVKCKNCGKKVGVPFLKRSKTHNIKWCLCDDCIRLGITLPKEKDVNSEDWKREVAKIVKHFAFEERDILWGDEE
jgi:hypothetical protein